MRDTQHSSVEARAPHTRETQSPLDRTCRWLAYAAVILGIVPLAVPIFLPDFLIGHDAGAHQTYTFQFNRALQQGQFPVRWVEGIGDGLGQPLFNYYQVGFYYLVALVHQAGPDLSLAFKLTIAIQWSAGAVFMFLLCRPLGSLPAALAAAIFLWSPYLLLNAYVRTAYPELTAIGFAPGVLWSLERVLRTGRPIFACALALTTGLLLISHLPTALIVAPVAAAFLVGSWIVHRIGARIVGLAAAGAIMGAGLAAFYILPAILELEAVKIARLTSAYFDYHRHFVRPEWWFDWSWGYGGSGAETDRLSVQIGIVQWIVVAASVTVLLVPRLRRRLPVPAAAAGWLAVVGAALFMMTPASVFAWERLQPMAFIQFPWRFLMLPTLACSVLAALLLSTVRQRTAQALLVLCAVAVQWYVTADYRAMARTRERAAITIDDPAWPSTGNAQTWAFREPAYDPVSVRGATPPASGRWTVGERDGTILAASVTDASVDLLLRAPEPVTLTIRSPHLPGWRVFLDDWPINPSIAAPSGYMEVQVPAGSHRVAAVFRDTRVRAAAEALTLLSLIAWLTLAAWPGWTWLKNRAGTLNVGGRYDPVPERRPHATGVRRTSHRRSV